MYQCLKCSMQYEEATKICRACGGIVQPAPQGSPAARAVEPSPIADAVDHQLQAAEGPLPTEPTERQPMAIDDLVRTAANKGGHWICTRCGERVPATFDVCWNCSDDPLSEPPVQAADEEREPAADVTPVGSAEKCTVCGSSRIMRDVKVCDQGQHSSGKLHLVVYGDPSALLFKNALYGELAATVCADCGRVDLHVANAEELYQRRQRSLD